MQLLRVIEPMKVLMQQVGQYTQYTPSPLQPSSLRKSIILIKTPHGTVSWMRNAMKIPIE